MSTILKTRTINNGALSVGFIPSANVKVFPCAYRGYINDNGISVGIDPESKANTEYNYVNMYSKLGTTKPSYVISNISNTLKCIIGGYYFEITGLGQEDFIETITDANNNVSYSKKYLVLNTKPIPMPVSETDSSRSTKVLKSLIDENVDYLDTKIDDTYYFVGLAVANTTTGFEASLAPFTVDEAAPQNWEAKTIYDVLDTGVGAYSLRSLCSNASEDNEAQNKHSIALGEGSKAYSDYQVVLGKYNNHIKSTSTDDDGNTVYEYYDDVVVVGNGNSTNRINSFRLSKEGNINTIGSITAAKKLTIGSEGAEIIGNVEIKSGTLKSAQKLTVESGGTEIIGNSTINGTVGITGNTSITGTLSATSTVTSGGKLTVNTGGAEIKSGGVDITGNSTVSGTFEATGNTTIGGTLSVDGNTNIDGTLDLTGTATLENGTLNFVNDSSGSIIYDSTDNQFELNKPLHVTGTITATGNMYAVDFQATGASTLTSVSASGDISTTANISATGSMSSASANVSGAVTAGSISTTGTAGISGNTTIGTSEAGATLVVHGNTTVGKLITGSDGAEIKGNTIITGTTNITGNTSITSGTLNVAKKLTVNSEGADITGNVALKGNTTIGTSSAKANLNVNGGTTITDTATIDGKTTIGTASDALNLEVTGKAKISGTLELPFNGTGLIVGKSATIGNMSINTTISGSGETETRSTSISGINSISATGNISTAGSITTTDGNIKTENGYVEAKYFNATYVNTSSDIRLKQNIEDYKCDKSILDLPIKKYEYINDPTKTQIGCIAQDLQKICPELVSENENGYLSIQENKLVYLLLQEVKTLKERIEELERR